MAIEDGSAQHLEPDETDPDVLANLDTIAAWLRLVDPWPDQVDLLLLFGGSMPPTWHVAADAVTSGRVGTLMLVGGRGHTTDALMTALGVDLASSRARTVSEAELMADWLRTNHGIDGVILETESTNCGNNVTLAERTAALHGLHPHTVALVQDPTMQRRMDAVFRHTWSLGDATAVNRPGPDSRADWPWHRWVGLVVGEVPRLRDDTNGYGPRGRGFIAHVDVPDTVADAYRALIQTHPDWDRTMP